MPGWWVSEALGHPQGAVYLVSWVVWVVVSIVLHELAHGWVAIRCGDQTPRWAGHMTPNPFVHIPGFAWLLFVALGITYGRMPVDPSRFRGRYDDAKVSAAGPAMNLLLAIVACVLGVAWVVFAPRGASPLFENVALFFSTGLMLNLVLMIFNLLPVPPLDGSSILGNFVPATRRLWEGEKGQIFAVIAFVGLFLFAGRLIWPVADGLAGAMITGVRVPLEALLGSPAAAPAPTP